MYCPAAFARYTVVALQVIIIFFILALCTWTLIIERLFETTRLLTNNEPPSSLDLITGRD